MTTSQPALSAIGHRRRGQASSSEHHACVKWRLTVFLSHYQHLVRHQRRDDQDLKQIKKGVGLVLNADANSQ